MELLLLKVMADALDPDPIDLITSNDHLTTMLAVIVAAGAFLEEKEAGEEIMMDILPVLNDILVDEPVVEKTSFIIPLIAVAAVSAIAIGLFYRKKLKK